MLRELFSFTKWTAAMIRFLKTVFQRLYTAKEIAATIEKHLIKPPLPPEWYDVAQSARDRQERGAG